jgi:hypothetical protein
MRVRYAPAATPAVRGDYWLGFREKRAADVGLNLNCSPPEPWQSAIDPVNPTGLGHLVIEETEARVVRRIFEWYVGGVSPRKIAA